MVKKINVLCLVGAHLPDERWYLEYGEFTSNNACRCKKCGKVVHRTDWLPQLHLDLQKLNRLRLKRKRDLFAASLPLFTTRLVVFSDRTNELIGIYRAGMAIHKKDLAKLAASTVIVSALIFGIIYQNKMSGLVLFDKLYNHFDKHPELDYYTL